MERELEACPRREAEDAEISACLTRSFQEDLLPNLRTGIPELGIHSIDPVTTPNVTFVLLDTALLRLTLTVEELVAVGMANITRAEVENNSAQRTITAHLFYPGFEGSSSRTVMELQVLGKRVFRQEGGVTFRMEGFSAVIVYSLRPTKTELVKVVSLEDQLAGLEVRMHSPHPSLIVWLFNWFMSQYGLQVYQQIGRPAFRALYTEYITVFMESKIIEAIIGDEDTE